MNRREVLTTGALAAVSVGIPITGNADPAGSFVATRVPSLPILQHATAAEAVMHFTDRLLGDQSYLKEESEKVKEVRFLHRFLRRNAEVFLRDGPLMTSGTMLVLGGFLTGTSVVANPGPKQSATISTFARAIHKESITEFEEANTEKWHWEGFADRASDKLAGLVTHLRARGYTWVPYAPCMVVEAVRAETFTPFFGVKSRFGLLDQGGNPVSGTDGWETGLPSV